MPNQEPASAWIFRNGPVRVGTQGLFRPYLKTLVPPFLPSWLTAPESPRMRLMWRKREFYGVIWLKKVSPMLSVEVLWVVLGTAVIVATVIYRVIYRECWQTNLRYVRLSSCYQNTLCQAWNASWVLSLGDFVLESLVCAQRLWILNLVSADTELWASRFDWLNDYNFWTFQMSLISPQKPVTSARDLYRLLPAIVLSLFSLS